MHKKADLLTVTKKQPTSLPKPRLPDGQESSGQVSNGVVKTIATGLGLGYIPIIPGTFASLFGFLIFWLVKDYLYVYGLFLIGVWCLGFIAVPRAERIFGKKDDRKIVIDEIFGILFSFWGIILKDVKLAIVGFFMFRLLDILKPFPARHIETLPGANGVMLDDFIAAGYTNLVLRAIIYFIR